MKKLNVWITALALFLIAGSLAAWAQPGPGRQDGFRGQDPAAVLEMLMERLELSDLQRTELQAVFAARKKNGQAARQALRQARTRLHERIHAEHLALLRWWHVAHGHLVDHFDRIGSVK